MISSRLRSLPENKTIDYLLGQFYSLGILECESLQKDSVIAFKDFERFPGIQVRVNSVRIVHSRKHCVGCVKKVERIGSAIAEIEIPREKCECRARIVEQLSFGKSEESGLKLDELRLDGYGYRSCTKVLSASGQCKCLCSGCLLSFTMSFALRGQLGFGLSLIPCGPAAHVFLSSQRNRKSGKRKSRLRPSSPLTLGYAERAIEPAAVVNWIRHVTSPVSDRAIVCGRNA